MSSPFDGSIVTDTGPLISLERLDGGYEFMRRMYRRIIAPPTVLREIAIGQFAAPNSYLEHWSVTDFVFEYTPQALLQNIPWQNDLHLGELEALTLAQELRLPLLIEEAVGRRVAQELNIPFSGMAGQVLKAIRLDILTNQQGRRMLEQLLHNGRISQALFDLLVDSLPKEGES
jgi:predicted nucleic acid-binding protein